jgi:[CysO sulfur-carrier protein]-S-L-cysteine hydrolase
MPFRILLPEAIYQAMLDHARRELPNECCGLLAGRMPAPECPALVERCYPLVNELASPTAYQAEPKSLFHAVKDMRPAGQEILAFYHSHPTSDPLPSRTDLASNFWGNAVVFFIISLKGEEAVMRGWWMDEASYAEAEWELVD